tara:strand:- start:384 stop:605 length:222 start_codon:yes stop_codon:yes gene_type:complete
MVKKLEDMGYVKISEYEKIQLFNKDADFDELDAILYLTDGISRESFNILDEFVEVWLPREYFFPNNVEELKED